MVVWIGSKLGGEQGGSALNGERANDRESGMFDHAAALVAFVKLAGVAQSKSQWGQRDKFLLLAAFAASRAGFASVASRCRELVLGHNPHHLIKGYATVEESLADADFQPFLLQLQRFCSYELAEHFLTQLQIAPGLPTRGQTLAAADYAMLLLSKADLQPGVAESG